MHELTGKQKRFLRSRGQTLRAAAIEGKAGFTTAFIAGIQELLQQHELVKVRISADGGSQRRQAGKELAERADAACAGVVGHTVLLYRPNEELPPDQRIHLPADRNN